NAIKHGIFSKVALLGHESRLEFDSLLNGFRNDLQPEGTLERVFVDRLAILSWRYRRFILAGNAEIQKNSAFLEWDEREREEKEANDALPYDGASLNSEILGLIHEKHNPLILERCLELLEELKEEMHRKGFYSESSLDILTTIYGNQDRRTETL